MKGAAAQTEQGKPHHDNSHLIQTEPILRTLAGFPQVEDLHTPTESCWVTQIRLISGAAGIHPSGPESCMASPVDDTSPPTAAGRVTVTSVFIELLSADG